MNTKLVAITLAALIAATASQAETALGRIVKIDRATSEVTLSNGAIYRFGDDVAMKALYGFRVGDSVAISYADGSNGMFDGRAMMSTDVNQATGKIAAIDLTARTVSLEGGKTFTFDEGTPLDGFRPGDMVRISFHRLPTGLAGDAIGVANAAGVTGTIEAIDIGAGTITVGGQMLKVDPALKAGDVLGGFLKGDQVHVITQPSSAGMVVEQVSAMNS